MNEIINEIKSFMENNIHALKIPFGHSDIFIKRWMLKNYWLELNRSIIGDFVSLRDENDIPLVEYIDQFYQYGFFDVRDFESELSFDQVKQILKG
jgi:hypothetical protein